MPNQLLNHQVISETEDFNPGNNSFSKEFTRDMTFQEEIDKIERQRALLLRQVHSLQKKQQKCCHDWSKVQYCPEVREAYDALNTQMPGPPKNWSKVRIPRQETPCWSRTCNVCGVTQFTSRTQKAETTKSGLQTSSEKPVFPKTLHFKGFIP